MEQLKAKSSLCGWSRCLALSQEACGRTDRSQGGLPSPLFAIPSKHRHGNRNMKKLVFSSLALGTLAGAIAGATVSCPIAARAAEPMRLAEAEMDGITAGASLYQATGGSVTGSILKRTGTATQSQHGSTLPGGGDEITGIGVALGTAKGSQTSGRRNSECRCLRRYPRGWLRWGCRERPPSSPPTSEKQSSTLLRGVLRLIFHESRSNSRPPNTMAQERASNQRRSA